jgi:hypothetical protein
MERKKQVTDINHLEFYNFFNFINLFLKNIYLYINVYNTKKNK